MRPHHLFSFRSALSFALLFAITVVFTPAIALASDRAIEGWEKIAQGALLVDVRTPQEFTQKHIDGAVNYPVQAVETAFDHIDKDTLIVLYCRSGRRSGAAFEFLQKAGYTQLHNAGGLEEMLAVKP